MNDKNREAQLTAEFADLIQTLERPEAKPYAPELAQEEKMKLRRRLLVQAERPSLSWPAVGNLWRFAGTAVFLAIVIIIGVYFWSAMSSPGQAGPGPVAAPQPTAMSESTVVPTAVTPPSGDFQFGNELILTGEQIGFLPDGMRITLNWFVNSQPKQDYAVFFHLLDSQGELAAQLDQVDVTLVGSPQPSELTSTWVVGERISQIYLLRYPPSGTVNGLYDLVMGLYDPRTGERLPVTAVDDSLLFDDGTAVFLGNWAFGSGPFDGD
jgi:hypothetical protein